MTRRLLITLISMVATIAAIAQTSVELSVPRAAYAGEPFSISVTVINPDGSVSTPAAPSLPGCRLAGGPAVSRASSATNYNGHRQTTEMVSYTYTYVADSESTVKVPSVNVSVGGKTFSTQPAQFTVEAERPARSNPYSGGGSRTSGRRPAQQAGDFEISPNELFMQFALSSSSVYEMQALRCDLKIYSTNQQIEGLTASELPKFDGCLIEPLPAVTNISWTPEQINGRTVYSAVIYSVLLYPQRSGELKISGGKYTVTAYREVMVQDFMMYRPYVETKEVELTPRQSVIKVKPLPEPRPADFSGAVGNFSISAELVGSNFRSNEAGSVIYTIRGTGNIKYFSDPTVDFPDEFEVYEPNTDTDARISGANMTGTRTIEYTFVPRSPGSFTIGAMPFTYFNPSSGSYVTDTVDGFTLDVEQGSTVSSALPGSNKQDVKPKNTDINYIRPGADKPSKAPDYAAASPIFWAMYPLLLLLFVAGAATYRRRITADPDGRRLKGAGKVARKRLAKAGKFLRAKHYDAYYEELLRAMNSYLSDKLQIPASQLSRDKVIDTLARREAPQELQQSVINIINDCEMARYTPLTPDAADATYADARKAIDAIERLKP